MKYDMISTCQSDRSYFLPITSYPNRECFNHVLYIGLAHLWYVHYILYIYRIHTYIITYNVRPPSDVSWFRFAPVTSSLFAYHKPSWNWSYKPTNWTRFRTRGPHEWEKRIVPWCRLRLGGALEGKRYEATLEALWFFFSVREVEKMVHL